MGIDSLFGQRVALSYTRNSPVTDLSLNIEQINRMGRPGVQLKFVGVIRLSDWRVDTWNPMSQPATLLVSELIVSNPPVAGPVSDTPIHNGYISFLP